MFLSFFNERDTENPEIRDMFKALGIIESFGTGIGEAKRSMRENGSPDLFYKTFDVNDNVTSVVIPVNEEYYEIKNGSKPKKKVWIETETKDFKQKILDSGYTNIIKQNKTKHPDMLFDLFKCLFIIRCYLNICKNTILCSDYRLHCT